MATQLCEKCKQAHPGRVCEYDEKGECPETTGINEVAQPCNKASKDDVPPASAVLKSPTDRRTLLSQN
jgi:hypothetical protein